MRCDWLSGQFIDNIVRFYYTACMLLIRYANVGDINRWSERAESLCLPFGGSLFAPISQIIVVSENATSVAKSDILSVISAFIKKRTYCNVFI